MYCVLYLKVFCVLCIVLKGIIVYERKKINVYGREQEFQFKRKDQTKKLWFLMTLTKSDLLVLGSRTWVLRRLSLPGEARLLSASRRLFMTISNYGKVIKPLE